MIKLLQKLLVLLSTQGTDWAAKQSLLLLSSENQQGQLMEVTKKGLQKLLNWAQHDTGAGKPRPFQLCSGYSMIEFSNCFV